MYQTRYPQMPRVDCHTHIARRQAHDAYSSWLAMREAVLRGTGADVALSIDLDGGWLDRWTQDPAKGLARVKGQGGGRVLATLADYRPAKGLNASSPDVVDDWLAAGFCGWKWHWNATFNGGRGAPHGMIDSAYFRPYLSAMEQAGMPLLCLHLDAPWGDGKAQRRALLNVMTRYPALVVVQAHFGAQRWGTVADHAKVFDEFPNFYRDVSTTAQNMPLWADYDEAREFFIRYSDRLLWGTDNMHPFKQGAKLRTGALAEKSQLQFRYWETGDAFSPKGIGATTPRSPETIKGMALPVDALERIYWRNAARIIPHVRSALVALGYAAAVGAPMPEPTPRAKRLLNFLPRLKPADIDTLNAEQRAGVVSQLDRLGLGG